MDNFNRHIIWLWSLSQTIYMSHKTRRRRFWLSISRLTSNY